MSRPSESDRINAVLAQYAPGWTYAERGHPFGLFVPPGPPDRYESARVFAQFERTLALALADAQDREDAKEQSMIEAHVRAADAEDRAEAAERERDEQRQRAERAEADKEYWEQKYVDETGGGGMVWFTEEDQGHA